MRHVWTELTSWRKDRFQECHIRESVLGAAVLTRRSQRNTNATREDAWCKQNSGRSVSSAWEQESSNHPHHILPRHRWDVTHGVYCVIPPFAQRHERLKKQTAKHRPTGRICCRFLLLYLEWKLHWCTFKKEQSDILLNRKKLRQKYKYVRESSC